MTIIELSKNSDGDTVFVPWDDKNFCRNGILPIRIIDNQGPWYEHADFRDAGNLMGRADEQMMTRQGWHKEYTHLELEQFHKLNKSREKCLVEDFHLVAMAHTTVSSDEVATVTPIKLGLRTTRNTTDDSGQRDAVLEMKAKKRKLSECIACVETWAHQVKAARQDLFRTIYLTDANTKDYDDEREPAPKKPHWSTTYKKGQAALQKVAAMEKAMQKMFKENAQLKDKLLLSGNAEGISKLEYDDLALSLANEKGKLREVEHKLKQTQLKLELEQQSAERLGKELGRKVDEHTDMKEKYDDAKSKADAAAGELSGIKEMLRYQQSRSNTPSSGDQFLTQF